jgi:hypothetical protein
MAGCALLAGCQTAPLNISLLQRSYQPNNVYAFPPQLSPHLERVAVLPIAAETPHDNLPEGCTALAPVLWNELLQTKRFEVVAVDPLRLRRESGSPAWTGGETLPADLLTTLRRDYGCDAVLFTELTAYRAYAPLEVGWRFKLVDARSGSILWAADEVFDGSRQDVAYAAQRHTEPGFSWPLLWRKDWLAANSPSEFGGYSAAALLQTLPVRSRN